MPLSVVMGGCCQARLICAPASARAVTTSVAYGPPCHRRRLDLQPSRTHQQRREAAKGICRSLCGGNLTSDPELRHTASGIPFAATLTGGNRNDVDRAPGRAPSGPADDAATVTARQLHALLRRLITAGQWRAGDADVLVIAASRPRCEWTTLGDPHRGWATAR